MWSTASRNYILKSKTNMLYYDLNNIKRGKVNVLTFLTNTCNDPIEDNKNYFWLALNFAYIFTLITSASYNPKFKDHLWW